MLVGGAATNETKSQPINKLPDVTRLSIITNPSYNLGKSSLQK
jgi:hypothetical protein